MKTDMDRYRWIETHVLPIEGHVRSRLKRRIPLSADLDDVVQKAYERLWRVTDFSRIPAGSVRKYFYVTAYRIWQDEQRRGRVVRMEAFDQAENHVDATPGPDRQVSARQEFERLIQAMRRLAVKQRTAFELRYFEALSVEEVARRMRAGKSTAETYLTGALVEVKRAMLGTDLGNGLRENERHTDIDEHKDSRYGD